MSDNDQDLDVGTPLQEPIAEGDKPIIVQGGGSSAAAGSDTPAAEGGDKPIIVQDGGPTT